MEGLHAKKAVQGVPVSEPVQNRAGVPVDRTVKHCRATLDDCLRCVGFTLQHWRLWSSTQYTFKDLWYDK